MQITVNQIFRIQWPVLTESSKRITLSLLSSWTPSSEILFFSQNFHKKLETRSYHDHAIFEYFSDPSVKGASAIYAFCYTTFKSLQVLQKIIFEQLLNIKLINVSFERQVFYAKNYSYLHFLDFQPF